MLNNVHIIMPVKDSILIAEQSIRAVLQTGYTLCVYDDYSTPENAAHLDALQKELGFHLIHIKDHINHPSPNYRWVLLKAQRECIEQEEHLIIIESDVIIGKETIDRLKEAIHSKVGMVAAVTTNEVGDINFPYEYARRLQQDGVCKKRLSFCCTLLTNELLQAYDFSLLDPTKKWYDVHISHMSQKLGFDNILQMSNPVLHKPHSSRPWKQLKYTNPIVYYWRKIIHGQDKI